MFRPGQHSVSQFLAKASVLGWTVAAVLNTAAACGPGTPFSSTPDGNNQGGDDASAPGGDGAGGHDGASTAGSATGGTLGQAGTADGSSDAGSAGDVGGQASGAGGAENPPLTCQKACVDPNPYCADIDGTPTCTNPALPLSGKRLELACVSSGDAVAQLCESVADRATNCPKAGKATEQVIRIGGEPGALYSVKLRVRGVVEPRTYVGGKDAGNHFYVGGTGQLPSNYNTFSIVVSSPAQTFYLNADTKPESYRVLTLDHEKSIVVAAGATVTLRVLDPDCAMVKNCQAPGAATCVPYVVEGVPPAPQPFNGQFVQLDVVGVTVSR